MSERCEHMVTPPYPNGFPRPRRCSRMAREGNTTCATHDPEAMAARKAKTAKDGAERLKERAARSIALQRLRNRVKQIPIP